LPERGLGVTPWGDRQLYSISSQRCVPRRRLPIRTPIPLKQLNLLGRWANDCADPAHRGVAYEIDRDGRAVFIDVAGPHRILSATSNDGREVVLTIKFLKPAEEVRINVFTMIDADTYVPTMNRNERNEYTVRDGILLQRPEKAGKCRSCIAALLRD
jgi:hypothetical protein